MIRIIVIISTIFISHCSFDNKTGIWKNNSEINTKKKESQFKDFKTIYASEESFNKIISPPDSLKIELFKIKTNLKWTDEFYKDNNNLDNFSYKNLNKIVFKSKKLSKYKVKENLLFDGENVVLTDEKGNVIIYSVAKQQIIYEYNFYKNKFKGFKKNLYLIIEGNIIYVADNIGYFYALDYKKEKLLWAKNFKVPFRSNLKIHKNKIFLANQNNTLFSINKADGERLRFVPSEEIILSNNFINSLAINDNSLLFLNTFGTLYSLNISDLKINWFVNLSQSVGSDINDIFFSNQITANKDNIIVSTDPYLYVLDFKTGATISKKLITSITKPILSKNGLFLLTKDDLLIYKDLKTQKIIYSVNVVDKIANFLNTKKKTIYINSFFIVNNELFIFLENSYLIKFNIIGDIQQINKLPLNIRTSPIFINDSILYLDKKKKLVILN